MGTALVTGSLGLVGSKATEFLVEKGLNVIGIDNQLRSHFFGENARPKPHRKANGQHLDFDIRDTDALTSLVKQYGPDLCLVLHTAAQPSHDWAAKDPFTDFSVNATGTLNILEACRQHAPDAVVIYTSTNKVYGDSPNSLPFLEQEKRYELDPSHKYAKMGIHEGFEIDQTTHSLFGVSKLSGDLYTQEYGRYFGLKTGVFRAGCITGPNHAGAKLHGFMSYLTKCAVAGHPYEIIGYKGKQVRDNIHAFDLVSACWEFFKNPRPGEVYNIGGSRHSNCSILEAIDMLRELVDHDLQISFNDKARTGDHKWWITDVSKFKNHYPEWKQKFNIYDIILELVESEKERRF